MLKPKSRKEDIIRAAAILFRKKGFVATSMRDIAKEVGIEAPSLYNHIKSKEEILSTILMELAHDFVNGMDIILSHNNDPATTLRQLIDLHIDITASKTNQISLLTDEWRYLKPDTKEEFIALRSQYESDFVCILKKGVEQKLFKDIDVSVSLFSILSTLRSLYAWYSAKNDKDLIAIKTQFHSLLLDGLTVQKSPNT